MSVFTLFFAARLRIFAAWIFAQSAAGALGCGSGVVWPIGSAAGVISVGTWAATLGLRAAGFGSVARVTFFGAVLVAAALLGSGLSAVTGDALTDVSLPAAGLAAFFAAGLAGVAGVLGLVPVLSAGAAFFAAGFFGAGTGGFTSSGFVIAKTPFY